MLAGLGIKKKKVKKKSIAFHVSMENNIIAVTPTLATGRRCYYMDYIIPFLISVMASIVGYYICKWLDGDE